VSIPFSGNPATTIPAGVPARRLVADVDLPSEWARLTGSARGGKTLCAGGAEAGDLVLNYYVLPPGLPLAYRMYMADLDMAAHGDRPGGG
jgi:hypothetical protein